MTDIRLTYDKTVTIQQKTARVIMTLHSEKMTRIKIFIPLDGADYIDGGRFNFSDCLPMIFRASRRCCFVGLMFSCIVSVHLNVTCTAVDTREFVAFTYSRVSR